MKQSKEETPKSGDNAGSFYDRIAQFHDLTFKFNQYGRSIERYLRRHPMPLPYGAHILDAGCGTGLLTLALIRTLTRPARINAVDLSASSLAVARKAVEEENEKKSRALHEVSFTQANVLALPFADASFDLVVTSGVLEYVPLEDGLAELARTLAPGGYLLHLPMRPTPVSRLLEKMYRFKTHPPQEVTASTSRFFQVVGHYRFPPLDPISWTKTALLARKVWRTESGEAHA
jgi:ubiquinone/menaquinone biosynthesis C-methylase UbiE